MKQYKHLFFDLDRTFWDVETNQPKAHRRLFESMELCSIFGDFESYYASFLKINKALWQQYDAGVISGKEMRHNRFRQLLGDRGRDDSALAERINTEYLRILPQNNHLLPYSIEILTYLKTKNYPIHIITNGLDDIQTDKMKNSGILHYFTHVIISESVGKNKPYPEIFHVALERAGAKAEESVMVGDDLRNDVGGALNIGMDCIWINSDGSPAEIIPTYEIKALDELMHIF